ncbi:MAG TPA: hypothetical protein VE987_16375, partial [Polyangiaceae bacterium]|nr:hypothetical protein [Polyangiaceae bacterium]
MTTAWSVRTRLSRIFDVRDGEGRVALSGFAVLLLLVIAAHTVLETARDTLLLTGPGPRALGAVYVAIAVCTLPAAAIAGRAATRFGVRRALTATLAVAVIAPASIFALPVDRATAVTLYVVDGVLASVLVPQFWSLVGGVLTVSQGRRLFGLIAAAGVMGGVLGSGLATAAIVLMPARYLLIVAALLFAAAAAVLTRLRLTARVTRTRAARPAVGAALRTVRDQPFLVRIALVVFLSTSTLLALDYLFKSSVARELPRAAVGPFVARYYFALNLVSLVVQLFVASAVVRAMGVASALLVTPALLLLAAAGAFVSGGAMPAVLALKGIDGSLRHSIHRITGELSYLPVPTAARQRVKPLVDGAVARAAQTATGAALIALGGTSLVSARPFALGVTLLALGWLGVAVTMRRPYLALLRRAIRGVSLGDASGSVDAIDLESAEVLVQRLASEDPLE